jgi:hypothetical protein
MPNRIVTRAEAITMIINAIGFENKAPEALPNLKFADSINDTKTINEVSIAADMVLKDDLLLKSEKNKNLKAMVINMFNPEKNIEFN